MIMSLNMMDSRLRASPRHGGTGGLLSIFFVTDPPRGRPVGGGGTHHIGWTPRLQSSYYHRIPTIFIENIQYLNAHRGSPTTLCTHQKNAGLPSVQVIRHHHVQCRGGKARQALIPSFFLHVLLTSYPEENSSAKTIFFGFPPGLRVQ